jgi:hypothetical protein
MHNAAVILVDLIHLVGGFPGLVIVRVIAIYLTYTRVVSWTMKMESPWISPLFSPVLSLIQVRAAAGL